MTENNCFYKLKKSFFLSQECFSVVEKYFALYMALPIVLCPHWEAFKITAHLPKENNYLHRVSQILYLQIEWIMWPRPLDSQSSLLKKEGIVREWLPWGSICGNAQLMGFSMVAFETWFCCHILMCGEKLVKREFWRHGSVVKSTCCTNMRI